MWSFHLALLTSCYRNLFLESDITVILSSKGMASSNVVVFLEPQSENIITCSWADVQWCRDQDSTSGTARAEFAGYLGSYTTENSHRISQDGSWCSPAFVQTHLQFQHSQQIRNTNLVTVLEMLKYHVWHPTGIKAEAGTEYTSPSFCCCKYKTVFVFLILLCRIQDS